MQKTATVPEKKYEREDLVGLTNPQLKEILKSNNLPSSGIKEVLIQRILKSTGDSHNANIYQ